MTDPADNMDEHIAQMLAELDAQYPDYEPESEIAQFYANRSVFITGATGFIGKALVEKLVRSCRDIRRIYVLIRNKRGKDAEERLAELIDAQFFRRLTATPEGANLLEDKVRVISGDITLPGFGISTDDMSELKREVSIVFNSAATVRFVDPIDIAVKHNICSITELMTVCDQLEKLEALIHLSTAYANCHKRDTIYEIFYEPPMRGKQVIAAVADIKRVAESVHSYPNQRARERESCLKGVPETTSGADQDELPVDYNRDACDLQNFYGSDERPAERSGPNAAETLLDDFGQLCLKCGNRPNTYTLTKAISESHLLDLVTARKDRYLGDSKIPVAVIRPSNVGCAWREPFVGLVDSFNGHTGVIVSFYTGALQAMIGTGERVGDMVPVDMTVNMVIASAWFLVEGREAESSSNEASRAGVDEVRGESPAKINRRVSTSSHKHQIKKDHGIYIFNYVSGYRNPLKMHQVADAAREIALVYPSKFQARLPSAYFFRLFKLYDAYDFLNHKLPAMLQDFVTSNILGRELTSRNSAVAAYWRVQRMVDVLKPFAGKQWRLCDSNVCALYERLSPLDKDLFQFDVENIDWTDYMRKYIIGARLYLLNDSADSLPAARRRMKRMQLTNSILTLVLALLVYLFLLRQPALESAAMNFVRTTVSKVVGSGN